MNKNSKVLLKNKLKTKSTIDIACLFIIIGLILFAGLMLKLGRYDSIFLSSLLILYFFQYEMTRKWVEKSITNDIETQVATTFETTKKITDLSNKQKDDIESYVQLVKNAIDTNEGLKQASEKTKQNAKDVTSKIGMSLNFSDKELEAVKANIEKMVTLRQKIRIIAELILELSEYTQQIGETIEVVEDIAEQTNMLALNAAVEAARAGENGKGFSVVAGEIRKLADESKHATTKITSLIKDIQHATNSTVMATEEGSKEIESGVELADNINTNIESLIKLINDVKSSAENICTDSETQANYSDSVNSIINEINEGLKTSLQVLEEKIKTTQDLDEFSDSFKKNID